MADIYRAGEAEVYVVRGGPVGEFDLPSVRSIVTTFDPRGVGLVIDEAALDLAAPVAEPRPGRRKRNHSWSRHGKGGTNTLKPGAAPGADADPSPDAL